jgi:putative DNA primase/helicase
MPVTQSFQKQVELSIFKFQNLAEMPIEEKEVYLDPWLTEKSITMIYGWRGVGKSFFVLGLLDVITKGTAFGPWNVEKSTPALYLDAEMPLQDIRDRQIEMGIGVDTKSPVYVYSRDYAAGLGFMQPNLIRPQWRKFMKDALINLGVKVWAADNLSSLMPNTSENDKIDWDPINQWLLDLRFAGISTILLHHAGKSGDQRGHSGREDNLDTSIKLTHPPGYDSSEGCKFVVDFQKNRVRSGDHFLIAKLQCDYDTGKWTIEHEKTIKKLEILKMIDAGESQKDIISALEVSKQYISKVRIKAKSEGLITEKGKLTQIGFQEVYPKVADSESTVYPPKGGVDG